MNNLLFGADPEVFVVENINGEEFAVPVPHFIFNHNVPVLEIDKDEKHPVLIKDNCFSIMMDGPSFEYTLPPVKTAKEFFNNMNSGLNALRDFAHKFGYKVVIKPSINYDFDKFNVPNNFLYHQCNIFGCDKDLDAILGDNYTSPEIDVKTHGKRYGGGHFHTSDNNELLNKYPLPFVKLMAICQGNYSIANSKYPELEKQRAWKYGQPARFRIQNYKNGVIGVEYRTPSNHWIENEETINGMFESAIKAYEFLVNGRVDIIKEYLDNTIEAISNANVALSKSILASIK